MTKYLIFIPTMIAVGFILTPYIKAAVIIVVFLSGLGTL